MCYHFTQDDEPQTVVAEKIQPITLTLTPDEASLLTTHFSDHPAVQFGRAVLLKRAPQTKAALDKKIIALVEPLSAIQDQYPGYPVVALPDGVGA